MTPAPGSPFCLKAHIHQALTVQRRVKEIERLWNQLEFEITRRRLPERAISALYEASIGLKVRSARYQATADVSNVVASRDLRMLVEAGLLVARGEKRGRFYLAADAAGGDPRPDEGAEGERGRSHARAG